MQTGLPKVTIGLPIYNGEKYMRDAIDSALAQTYRDFELVICDNASEDETEAICRNYAAKDSRVRYIRHEKNLGAAINHATCFDFARGQYFLWLMHDDMIGPETLERCVAVLDADPEVGVAYPRTMDIDANGRWIRDYDEDLDLRADSPHRRLEKCLLNTVKCTPALGLIRSDVLGQTRLIDCYRGSDHVLLAELAMLGKFHEVPDRLILQRDHEESSLKANKTNLEILQWFDPSYRGKGRSFKLRMFWGFVTAVGRARLGMLEKMRCFIALRRWVIPQLQIIGGRYKARLFRRLHLRTQ